MLRFIADENFNATVLRGLGRSVQGIDVVRVQDVGLEAATNQVILSFAAAEGRLLLTHDIQTMTGHAAQRLRDGVPMPGVICVPQTLEIGTAVRELQLFAECSLDGEWDGCVIHLPLRH